MNSAAHIKQKRCVTCAFGYNDSRALYRASFESCKPNRNSFSVGTKLKESIFKSNNQIDSTVTTGTWVMSWSSFVQRMIDNVAKHKINVSMKI